MQKKSQVFWWKIHNIWPDKNLSAKARSHQNFWPLSTKVDVPVVRFALPVCPVDSIELVAGPDPSNPTFQQTVEIDLARCIGCQNCAQDCPWETITMYNHNEAFSAWAEETLKSELYIPQEMLAEEDKKA